MTLDDAILKVEEVAEECEHGGFTVPKIPVHAAEQRQIAEWLKQLRVYKLAFGINEEKVTGIVCCDGKVYKAFENDPILKAIDKKGFHTFYGFVEVDE